MKILVFAELLINKKSILYSIQLLNLLQLDNTDYKKSTAN